MFGTRLISGIIMVAAAILLLFFGTPWLAITICMLSVLGVYELLKVIGMEKSAPGIVSYISVVLYYVILYMGLVRLRQPLMLFTLIIMMMVYVLKYPRYKFFEISGCFFSFFYVGILFSYLVIIRQMDAGAWYVWLIIFGSWGADTCAYVTGKLIGKHHFTKLSPKKTIEGCIGGVVGAMVLAGVYGIFFPYKDRFFADPVIIFAGVSGISALISIFGDLAASAIKRNYDIKDYSKLIPGHGGVLDRFDSVLFVAPFLYYLMLWIQ